MLISEFISSHLSLTRVHYAHTLLLHYYTIVNVCQPFILDFAFFEFNDHLYIFVSPLPSLELSHRMNHYALCLLSSVHCIVSLTDISFRDHWTQHSTCVSVHIYRWRTWVSEKCLVRVIRVLHVLQMVQHTSKPKCGSRTSDHCVALCCLPTHSREHARCLGYIVFLLKLQSGKLNIVSALL